MATLKLTGGQVFDLEAGTVSGADVHVADGIVVDALAGEADRVVDVDGAYVAPGFIDLHTHVFSHPLFDTSRLEADRIGVQQGVACVVDAGSSGAATIDAFERFVRRTQATATFAFINIGSPGLPNLGGGHASRPELCDLPGTVRAFERHDWLVGVKVLASASHTGSFGLEAVKLARKAAELVGKPLMLHVGNAPPLIDDVLDLLRPGDIVTHTYHGKIGGVLGFADAVIPAFKEAVERGIVVDVGHGRSSFCFRVCETALAQGMPVHTISSDLHRGNVDRYAVSLARTMTKLRALGMSLMDVVRAVTRNPAIAVGLDRHGFGTIRSGQRACLTVFDERDEPMDIEDSTGDKRQSPSRIETRGVVLGDAYYERTQPL
ncbi:MAG: amidohydrolase/deacetylase family metallohydrolase [Gammaproteobacteria bacterium]|nr:amidohydrolase/deacetylase family metallohydrolase [Gammaproteobacteria bacterium]